MSYELVKSLYSLIKNLAKDGMEINEINLFLKNNFLNNSGIELTKGYQNTNDIFAIYDYEYFTPNKITNECVEFNNLKKSESDELKDIIKAIVNKIISNDLEKSKKFPPGTIRNWGGKNYKKVSEGKWEEVKKPGSGGEKKEESGNKISAEKQKGIDFLDELSSMEDNHEKRSKLYSLMDEFEESEDDNLFDFLYEKNDRLSHEVLEQYEDNKKKTPPYDRGLNPPTDKQAEQYIKELDILDEVSQKMGYKDFNYNDETDTAIFTTKNGTEKHLSMKDKKWDASDIIDRIKSI